MKVYYLDQNPVKVAEYYIDRHVLIMIKEIAQLLSNAHRILDGVWKKQVLQPGVYRNLCTLGWSGRVDHAARLLPGEGIVFLSAVQGSPEIKGWTVVNEQCLHLSEPKDVCSIWTAESIQNYLWLYELLKALCAEKAHRFPKSENEMSQYMEFLKTPPRNQTSSGFTPPPLVMPASFKTEDVIESYRGYYIGDKYHIAKWTNRSIPRWYLQGLSEAWKNDPESRIKVLKDHKKAKKTDITMRHVKKYIPNVFTVV